MEKIQLTLKDLYQITYGTTEPFSDVREHSELLFNNIAAYLILQDLNKSKKVNIIDLYCYYLQQMGITLDDVGYALESIPTPRNIDAYLYQLYWADDLFKNVQENYNSFVLKTLGVNLSKVRKESLDFTQSKLFWAVSVANTKVLRPGGNMQEIDYSKTELGQKLILLIDEFSKLNLGKEYPTEIAEHMKEEGISVEDIVQARKALLQTCPIATMKAIKKALQQKAITAAQKQKETLTSMARNLGVISEKVVGQKSAIETIKNRILAASIGFKSQHQPIASFLLTGPTGVGKTETAKAVAEACFDGKFFVVDMSTYKNRGDVSRLLGGSPNYVGYNDANAFCDFLKENPNSVILFDEIEKGDSECLDLLMRILDEGQFINAKGEVISMEGTVIFCTTNLTQNNVSIQGFGTAQGSDEKLAGMGLKKELIGRFTEVIEYRRLEKQDCKIILKTLFIKSIIQSFESNNQDGIKLEYTEELLDRIVEEANTKMFGARDLRKAIQKLFINRVCDYIIENNPQNTTLVVGEFDIEERALETQQLQTEEQSQIEQC